MLNIHLNIVYSNSESTVLYIEQLDYRIFFNALSLSSQLAMIFNLLLQTNPFFYTQIITFVVVVNQY